MEYIPKPNAYECNAADGTERSDRYYPAGTAHFNKKVVLVLGSFVQFFITGFVLL